MKIQTDRKKLMNVRLDVRRVGFKVRKYSYQNWTDIMRNSVRITLIKPSFDARTFDFERFSDYIK